MRKSIAGLVLLAVLSSCGINKNADKSAKHAPADSNYIVKGKIIGRDTGWVYLSSAQKRFEKTDSAKLDNGNFKFTGFATEPQFAQFGIIGEDDSRAPLYLFLEPGTITIEAFADVVEKAKVSGGTSQDDLEKFTISLHPLEAKQEQLMNQYQQVAATGDTTKKQEIIKRFEEMDAEHKALVAKFVKANPASYVSAVQLALTFGFNPDPKELEPLYNSLEEKIKSSYYGEQIKVVLESAKKAPVGAMAPEFTLNDVTGKPVSLSSFKGKYTLVEFWASWCAPCRQENPNVIKAYNMYNTKGFEVLGVSLDDEKEDWTKAIKDDKLPWTHVSDLEGWQSAPATLYGVKFVPINFLLDKDGKIIARSLRGEGLIKKLGELLN
ncbi:MAG TPA: TlpA disulfide reductase family protein [Agriterribacter sp.]|nr:TlpA disulfide reductase family protein [Agriterribacter sp.]